MSIRYNGTEIKKLIYNGIEVNTGIYNGVEVYTGSLYNKLKNATSTDKALTEEEWIEFINSGGIEAVITNKEQSSFLKKYITISNSQTPNYSYWQIGDFNHDSTSGTVDLICANNVISRQFESSEYWKNCGLRSWLNGAYYSAFSTSIKNLMKTMIVSTDGSTTSDNVKIVSCTELGYNSFPSYMVRGEGTAYPIFTPGSCGSNLKDRWRSGVDARSYWTRSRYTNTNTARTVWLVNSSGYGGATNYYTASYGVVPVIRMSL